MGNSLSSESSGPTVRPDVFTLFSTLGMIAKAASDDVLNTIDSNRQLSPVIAYTIYEQFYFLLLHMTLRIAFTLYGPDSRDLIQDLLAGLLFKHIPHYLNARYKPRKISDIFIRNLEELFVDRLNRSEHEYSQEQEYIDTALNDGVAGISEGLKHQLAGRLTDALLHSEVELAPTFPSLVKQVVSRRAGNVLPLATLVDEIIKST